MVTNARLYVDPPQLQAAPYDLFSVVDWVASDVHAGNGLTWSEVCPDGLTTFDACITSAPSASGTPTAKSAQASTRHRGATPFTVYTEVDCSPPGFADDAESTIKKVLREIAPAQVQSTFWTGVVNGVSNAALPHLAANATILDPNSMLSITLQPAAVTVTGTAVPIDRGLGLLEAALGDCIGENVGVIHAPATAGAALRAAHLIEPSGSVMYTSTKRNKVVIGATYPGTGPDGSAPAAGTTWLYATGPVMGYRGTAKTFPVRDSINRTNNTIKMIGEQTFVLGFRCCLLAVLVSTAA